MAMKNNTNLLSVIFLLSAPIACFGQESSNQTYFSNALFNTLLGVIIFLLIIIIAFSNVMKNVIDSDIMDNKLKEDNKGSGTLKSAGTLFLLFAGLDMMAANSGSDLIGGIDQPTFYFMLSIIFIEVLVLGLLVYQFKYLMRSKEAEVVVPHRDDNSIIAVLTDAVAIEEE